MIACPNCGGNVRFDIPSQQLACDYCHSQFDPYTFDSKTEDGKEEQSFDATIFTCPQCGGEIYSTDDQSAGFCSFCGASTILFTRLERTQRPGFVIPFKKTKEDCKRAYEKQMKRTIFAPKELRSPKNIDSFRGIYMPYWAFHYSHNTQLDIPAKKVSRSGDYIITDHYRITGTLKGYHKGLYHDASSSFADNISEKLSPYDVKGMKRFTPGFLSGFYADTQNVDSQIYEAEAKEVAVNDTIETIKKDKVCSRYTIEDKDLDSAVGKQGTNLESVDSALFPVWFMSYRNKDRVAYATVNGQTGKVVADIPIDIKKYLAASLILAVPLFLVFSLFLSLVPSKLVAITGLLAVVSAFIYVIELSRIVKEQSLESDRGLYSTIDFKKAMRQPRLKKSKEKKKKKSGSVSIILIVTGIYMCFTIGGFVFAFLAAIADELFSGYGVFYWLVLFAAMLVCYIIGGRKMARTPEKESLLGFVASGISVLISGLICIFDPIYDIYFYSAAALNLIAIILNIRDIINYYNVLSTRRLPQFDKQGGDDRA